MRDERELTSAQGLYLNRLRRMRKLMESNEQLILSAQPGFKLRWTLDYGRIGVSLPVLFAARLKVAEDTWRSCVELGIGNLGDGDLIAATLAYERIHTLIPNVSNVRN